MASIVTTISLCPKSHEIAKKLNNFSEFVRTALFVHAGDKESMHTMSRIRRANGGYRMVEDFLDVTYPDGTHQVFRHLAVESGRCDPFDRAGQCAQCWPPMNGKIQDQVAALKARLIREKLELIKQGRDAYEAKMKSLRESSQGEEE